MPIVIEQPAHRGGTGRDRQAGGGRRPAGPAVGRAPVHACCEATRSRSTWPAYRRVLSRRPRAGQATVEAGVTAARTSAWHSGRGGFRWKMAAAARSDARCRGLAGRPRDRRPPWGRWQPRSRGCGWSPPTAPSSTARPPRSRRSSTPPGSAWARWGCISTVTLRCQAGFQPAGRT